MKRLLAILVVGVLFCNMGLLSFAAEENATQPNAFLTSSGGVQPKWVYQFEFTSYMVVNMGDNLAKSMYVSIPTDYTDSAGKVIYARGTLYLSGTAYDFPKVGQKQGIYTGTVSAYINN